MSCSLYHGITAVLGPLIPFLLILEMIRAALYKRFKVIDYKISFFTLCTKRFCWQSDRICHGRHLHRVV